MVAGVLRSSGSSVFRVARAVWTTLGRASAVTALLFAAVLGGCGTQPKEHAPPSDYLAGAHGKDKVIVFVHGVFGDPKSTWTNSDTGTYWPELIAHDPQFADFDVFVASFDSPMFGRAADIVELGDNLRVQLTDNGVLKHREVYFIVHSMGGLITKRALLGLPLDTVNGVKALRNVRAVLFFSTPAQGATLADLAHWVSVNPQLGDMRPADLNTFIQGLERDWQALLRDRDTRHSDFPMVFCAYETKGMFGVGPVVVNRLYATTRCDGVAEAEPFDHIQIVKPESTQAVVYSWAKFRIQEAESKVETPVANTAPSDRVPSATPEKPTIDFDGKFQEVRTNELELARWGERAFESGQYAVALKFFKQAKAVESSGVWQSSYPFFAGAYILAGQPAEAALVLKDMDAAIARASGYLSSAIPLGFLLDGLGKVRARLPVSAVAGWDLEIDRVLAAKAAAAKRNAL
jgi:pimeloyl-ACP methyl ester carboxylesterase